MGFIFADLVVETIIREGLADLKANLDARLNVLFEQLKSSYLNAEYGQAELDRFKTFLTNEKIDVVHSWRQVEERVPCFYIQTIGGPEDTAKAMLEDYSGDVDTIVLGELTDRKEETTIVMRESLQVGVHVNDPGGPTALRWLYACLFYFLCSRKHDLMARGIDLSTLTSSDFNRLNELLPEHIYSRYVTLSYNNYMTWVKRDSEMLIEEFDLHGGPDASAPGEEQGGLKIESGREAEYEEGSVYTIDPTTGGD